MKQNLQTYLKQFENGETIDAFDLVGGPDITGRHLCNVLAEYKENYDSALDNEVMKMTEDCGDEEFVEDCAAEINSCIVEGTRLDEIQDYISLACRDLGYDSEEDIESLADDEDEELLNQTTYQYLQGQVEKHTEEFFKAYLIKYVLLPKGIKSLDSAIFAQYFNSRKYGYKGSETKHTQLVSGFTKCLRDNGVNL